MLFTVPSTGGFFYAQKPVGIPDPDLLLIPDPKASTKDG
jgi:hypothetical protein